MATSLLEMSALHKSRSNTANKGPVLLQTVKRIVAVCALKLIVSKLQIFVRLKMEDHRLQQLPAPARGQIAP
jgi:hypothetical protein